MSFSERIHFWMITLVHETLYGLIRDPYKILTSAGIREGQRVLEIGPGPGFFTIPAAEMVGETGWLCAADNNPYAVKHVRKKIAKSGLTNIQVVEKDITHTGLEGETFDLAFMFGFHHFRGDMDPILREVHRLLTPGGTLVVEGELFRESPLFETLNAEDTMYYYRKNASGE